MSPPLPAVALDLWTAAPVAAVAVEVLPDGCRDLVMHLPRGGPPACFASALAESAESVVIPAGDRLVGVRLQPGARFDEAVLCGTLVHRGRFDVADVLAAVGEHVTLDGRVSEALACLASAPSLAAARSVLGVSARSLERLLSTETGRTPLFWKNLARARRCGRELLAQPAAPLAALASDHGYADQAHMTRALRGWFGAPPAVLRSEAARYAGLAASGHG